MCVPRFYVGRGGDKYIYTTTSTNLIKIFLQNIFSIETD